MGPFHCFKAIYGGWKSFRGDLGLLWTPLPHPSLSYYLTCHDWSALFYCDSPCFEFTSIQVERSASCPQDRARTVWVSALTLRQGDHPSSSSPNPCLNTNINNPLSQVHCQPSLDPTEEGAGRQIAKEKQLVHLHVSHSRGQMAVKQNGLYSSMSIL